MINENSYKDALIGTEDECVSPSKHSLEVKSLHCDDDFLQADKIKDEAAPQSNEGELKTNRFKAVLFVNLSYFAMFFYNVLLKVAIN